MAACNFSNPGALEALNHSGGTKKIPNQRAVHPFGGVEVLGRLEIRGIWPGVIHERIAYLQSKIASK